MTPTRQDRELHEYLYRIAASGEPVTPQEILQVIDYANRLAVERCRECKSHPPCAGGASGPRPNAGHSHL